MFKCVNFPFSSLADSIINSWPVFTIGKLDGFLSGVIGLSSRISGLLFKTFFNSSHT